LAVPFSDWGTAPTKNETALRSTYPTINYSKKMKPKTVSTSIKLFLLSAVMIIFSQEVLVAQETTQIEIDLKKYNAQIHIQTCNVRRRFNDPNFCNGSATVSLFRRGEKSPFQVLNLPNVEIKKNKPNETLIFKDFNFDSKTDLAVLNGHNGGYSGPSYDVFLFDPLSNKFVRNNGFTKLAQFPYLGFFRIDSELKTLSTVSKSGCCYHEFEKYQVLNNLPVLTEKIINDATSQQGNNRKITTKKLVDGQWVVTVEQKPR
jgi:hypothetical protein